MHECNETITVFNSFVDDDKGYDVYAPTVIRGVSWYEDIVSNVDESGLRAANKFVIRIPVDADFSGKTYVKAYTGAEGTFTLRHGDIIVHAEETEGLNPAALKQKYGEIVTILGVTDSTRRPNGKHWKVVGS